MSETKDLPMQKPCPEAKRLGLVCSQGMVLEEDACDPTGETEGLPRTPKRRYRCQDCDWEEEIADLDQRVGRE
jgi:hypothetical protein